MTFQLQLAGECVELRADRTLYWPTRRTLLVADLHFGKAETFRAAAIPVPGDAEPMLTRLDHALKATGAERLIVLGDFWHARSGRTPAILGELDSWRAEHTSLRIDLVRGNHDRAGAPPASWCEEWTQPLLVDRPFVFTHFPTHSELGYVLAGHVHPGVRLLGTGRQRLRLPCFRFGERVGILPAFGDFTGSGFEPGGRGERVFAVAGDEVIEVS